MVAIQAPTKTTTKQKRIKLTEPQSRVFNSKKRFIILVAGTRFGKTYMGLTWLLREALSGDNREVWYCAPTYRQAKRVAWEQLKQLIPLHYVQDISEMDMRIKFITGSVIALRGTDDYNSLLGVGLDAVCLDEYEIMNPMAWTQVIRARLSNKEGKALFIGTPIGKNHYYQLYKWAQEPKQQTDWDVFVYTTADGGNVSKAEIANMRQQLTERQYREQLLATFEDVPGALWTQDMIDRSRIEHCTVPLDRIVVAIDPAVTANEDSDETGIIVAGKGADGHFYILKDVSGRYTPKEWALRAIEEYKTWQADRIIGEGNNGGDLVEGNIRAVDMSVPFTKVIATRGKILRAEPISALYERNMAHHVGKFFDLEEQMCLYSALDPNAKSPDRMDALVWAGTDLMVKGAQAISISLIDTTRTHTETNNGQRYRTFTVAPKLSDIFEFNDGED